MRFVDDVGNLEPSLVAAIRVLSQLIFVEGHFRADAQTPNWIECAGQQQRGHQTIMVRTVQETQEELTPSALGDKVIQEGWSTAPALGLVCRLVEREVLERNRQGERCLLGIV